MFAKRDCRVISQRLWQYAASQLLDPERERVAEHLQRCHACRKQAAAYRTAARLVAAHRDEPLPAVPAPWQELRERLEADPAPGEARRRLPAPVPRAIGAAAAVLLIVAGLARPGRVPHRSSSPVPQAAMPAPGTPPRAEPSASELRAGRPVQPATAAVAAAIPSFGPAPAPRDRRIPAVPLVTTQPADRRFTRGARLRTPPLEDELAYLNADAARALVDWARVRPDQAAVLQARLDQLVQGGDDFVSVPFPRVASRDPGSLAAAAAVYRREKATLDTRLVRKVSLAVKAMALSDLCQQLQDQTGIALTAGRSVADDKVTIFCDERPLRELMRQITRLFGFTWSRSGEEGSYRYELTEDLRSQLAEEELRNKDLNEALLDLNDKMAEYRPYTEKSLEELRQALSHATGPEQERLRMLTQLGGMGALRVYNHLTPAQLTALKNGQELRFGYSPWHTDRLPDEWRKPLLDSLQMSVIQIAGEDQFGGIGDTRGTLVADHPAMMPQVSLKINRSELGEVVLEASPGVANSAKSGWPGIGIPLQLAKGQSPSSAKPENALINRAVRDDPFFRRSVSLRPRPSCPVLARRATGGKEAPLIPADELRRAEMAARQAGGAADEIEVPHVTSDDVWEAVHQATGLPVIADSYTQIYRAEALTVSQATLFDAICRVADEMRTRWKREDGFLLCRHTRFFWNRLKEVPNRLLVQWRQDRRQQNGLPLEDLLGIAALPDYPLDSALVARSIEHCWELPEWGILGGHPKELHRVRPYARFLAVLTPDQRRQAQRPEGLRASDLTPAQQQELTRTGLGDGWTAHLLLGARLFVDYAPAGWFVWHPVVEYGLRDDAQKWRLVAGESADATLAAARKIYPRAASGQVERTTGVLVVTLLLEDGTPVVFGDRPVVFLPLQ